MNTPTKKALIYCRVSSKTQLDGGGLGSQEHRCQEYAKMKGYEVITVFRDSYTGGGDFMNRPAMRELLSYVDEYPDPYVVIFDDVKRFARDLKFHIALREEFRFRSLVPESPNFSFDETPEGIFIESIIAAQGELERRQNQRQTIQKMRARLARGIYCFTRPPHGYRYVKSNVYGGHVLEIEPKDAAVIREAFTAFAIGKFYHIKEVAEYITKHKHKCAGQVVKYHTARNMLTNVVYTGCVEYKKWNISLMKGIHDPIISFETYQKIQERLNGKTLQRSRKDFTGDFPLRGFINCAFCNHPFTASWSKSRTGILHPYYRCASRLCEFRGKSIAQDKVHEHFLDYLERLTPHKAIIPRAKLFISKEFIRREKTSFNDQQKKHQMANVVEVEMSGLVKMIAANANSPLVQLYEQELLKLQYQKVALEVSETKKETMDSKYFEPLVEKAFKPFKTPYFIWLNAIPEQRKTLQKILFSSNLIYSKFEGFRTTGKSEIYSLFDKIEAEFAEKSTMRTKGKKVRTMTTQDYNNLVQELKRCAELADQLEDEK